MERVNDLFITRIAIEGIINPVCFTFRMMYGEYGVEYKIRTAAPPCDFNMSRSETSTSNITTYKLTDNKEVPVWLNKDKNLQAKLSEAIVNSFL